MKLIALWVLLAFPAIAGADLTIVQRVDMGGTPGEMTVKMKGDKLRVDPAPQMSMITDNKTGDTVTLMHGEKKAMRMSGEKMKAAAEMVNKFAGGSPSPGKSKLTPTGRKETINGMATEVYSVDTGIGKATYYIATNYPDAAAILAEMKTTQPSPVASAASSIPDFRDLPGVPLKIEMDTQGNHIVMTLVAIKRDPIPDSEFTVPDGYVDMKMPDLLEGKAGSAASSVSPKVPVPQTGPSTAPTPP